MYQMIILIFLTVSLQAQTWERINTTFTPEGVSTHIKGYFTDSLNGWCANEYLYKTSNGGIDWNKIDIGTGSEIYDVNFFTENFGICQEWRNKYRTSDGGISWHLLDSFPGHFLSIVFSDSQRGITGNNRLYYTTDGGLSWDESSYSFEDSFAVQNLQILSNGTAWAFAITNKPFSGTVLKSTDFGKSWNKVLETENRIINGHFINDMHGVVVEYDWPAKAYITRDGGETWSVCADSLTFPTVVYLLNENLGWLCADEMIYETNDGGNNWYFLQQVQLGVEGIFNRIVFTRDKKKGFMFGSYGIILTYDNNVTNVEETDWPAVKFELMQNYPNPFNPTTTIEYIIPAMNTNFASSTFVSLTIFDCLGRKVKTLVNEEKAPGNYSVKFDASGLSSGVYYYKLNSGIFSKTRKLVLLE